MIPGSPPLLAALPPMMGAVAAIAVHHLWLWVGRRGDRVPLWVTGWCGATLLFLGGHYLQLGSATADGILLGGRMAWVGALFIVPILMGLVHALSGREALRWALWPVTLVSGTLVLVLVLTRLILSDETHVRADLFGYRYGAPVPGPLMPLVAAYVFAALAFAWWKDRGPSPLLDSREHRAIRAGFTVYALAGFHDILNAAQVIRSVPVFDYAFVAGALGLTYLLARRHNRLQSNLKEEVTARTVELGREQERLAALVRAGRNLMSGLDLGATLQRIVEEATRFTGSPHVKVLLVDRAAGVLRMGAVAGGTVPAGFQVPLGTSYSGTIAVTGQLLFVADTQNDPRNLLAARDRAEGIRTYLGLPIRKGDEVLGVLTVNTSDPREYTPEELDSLGSFADQAALAIDNARLFEDSEMRRRRLTGLVEMSRRLTGELDSPTLLASLASGAAELFRGEVGFRVLEGEWLVRQGATPGALAVMSQERIRLGESISGRVATTGQAYVTTDTAAEPQLIAAHRDEAAARRARTGALLCVPMRVGARILGTLNVYGPAGHRFDADAVALGQSLADQAAIAIDNARLYEASKAQTHELLALNEVSTALVSTLDTDAVLDAVVDWAVKLIGCQNSTVFRFDPRDGLLHPHRPITAAPYPVRVVSPGQGASGGAFARRTAVANADLWEQSLPGYEKEAAGTGRQFGDLVRSQPFRGVLAVPIESRDRALGSIIVRWAEPHAATEREIKLLTAFARQAAVALENAELYEAVEARLVRLETLTRLNRLISSSLDRDRVLSEITRAAAELVGAAFASFWLADETSRSLEMIAFSDPAMGADFPMPQMGFDHGIIGWIATHRQQVGIDDVATDPRIVFGEWARQHEATSLYGVPVVADGALIGVLCLNGRQPFRFARDEEQLLESFVAQAAIAVRNASLFQAEGRARREAELALSQVKQLHGLLPICAYCKRVRNDRNYWEQIESYIGERSQASFSHGICPECRATVVQRELDRWKEERS